MGFHGALWGIIGLYGALWGIIGLYGAPWDSMGQYRSLWGSMGLCAAVVLRRRHCNSPPVRAAALSADVVHWRCLRSHCRSLPPRTAPAGFRCPTCAAPLFPPPDTRGPVADALRSRLAAASWARPGLGLPLVSAAVAPPTHLAPPPSFPHWLPSR